MMVGGTPISGNTSFVRSWGAVSENHHHHLSMSLASSPESKLLYACSENKTYPNSFGEIMWDPNFTSFIFCVFPWYTRATLQSLLASTCYFGWFNPPFVCSMPLVLLGSFILGGGIPSTAISCSRPSVSCLNVQFVDCLEAKFTIFPRFDQPLIMFLLESHQIRSGNFVGSESFEVCWGPISVSSCFICFFNPSVFPVKSPPCNPRQVAAVLAPERREAGGSALEATGPWGIAFQSIVTGI